MTLAIPTSNAINMNSVKKEIGGFGASSPYSMPSRPHFNRPFSDGSMSIETDVLAGLLGGNGNNNHTSHSFAASTTMASPFQYGSSLPPAYHYSSNQPMSAPLNFGGSPNESHASPQQGMNPAAFFNSFKFSDTSNDAHPVSSSVPTHSIHLPDINGGTRSRSASATRQKSTSASRRPSAGRKLSTSSTTTTSQHQRGRSMQPPQHIRTMSQSQLQSHPEDDSVSPPDGTGYGNNSPFGLAIPLGSSVASRGDWVGSASQTSTLLDTMGSFSGANEPMQESPVTTSQSTMPLDDQGKKQRRRECHNQVEKRRREHINAKIEELSQLVPTSYGGLDDRNGNDDDDEEDGNGDSPKKKKTKRTGSAAKGSKDSVQCKGRILTQSVQYIRDLKRQNDYQQSRIAQLEAVLMAYNPNYQSASVPNVHPTHPYFFPQGSTPASFPAAYPQPQQNGNGLHAVHESQLETMPRSPEPEQHLALNSGDSWPQTEQQQQQQPVQRARSVSISSDDSPDTRTGDMMGMMDFVAEETGQHDDDSADADPMPLPDGGERGRPRERRDSQMDLQISMGGMGLEAMFSSVRRQEEAGGMRW